MGDRVQDKPRTRIKCTDVETLRGLYTSLAAAYAKMYQLAEDPNKVSDLEDYVNGDGYVAYKGIQAV